MPGLPGWLVVLGRYVPTSKTGRAVVVVAGSTLVVLISAGLYFRRKRRRKGIVPNSDESVDYTRLRSTSLMSPYSHGGDAILMAYPSSHQEGPSNGNGRASWQPASQFHSTEELCAAGLQAVQAATHYWHTAVTRLRNRTMDSVVPDTSSSSSEFGSWSHVQSLEVLIAQAHQLEEVYRQRMLAPAQSPQLPNGGYVAVAVGDQTPPNEQLEFRDCMSPGADTDGYSAVLIRQHSGSNSIGQSPRHHQQSMLWVDSASSSGDSFVSATQQIDSPLSGMQSPEELSLQGLDLGFYNEGMDEALAGKVPFRALRTEMLSCLNDHDFLAKLFCIRQAFQHLMKNKTHREWIISCGCRLVSLFLQAAGKEVNAFKTEYQALVAYVEATPSDEMFEELKERRLACFSFYDVVLDFALMDAFADLESPPSTITSVLANRWLTDGFKETALNTAVWSMLKAKRSLVSTDGFMHHFYNVMSTLSPILAWGFLGPDRSLRGQCAVFKDQVLHLMRDIFSLTTVRYSSLDTLSEDILESTKVTYEQLVEHFQASIASL